MFFSNKNKQNEGEEKKEDKQATEKEEKKEATQEKKGDEKKAADAGKKKAEESSSSSESDGEAESLSKADIEKIKKLIADQDKEIETLKEQVKQYKEKLIYQLAENDNTIKRYKKEIDSTREFAITKFAKDLLDVRDNLELASQHVKKIKLDEVKDIEELKKLFTSVADGMNMTSHVMDNTLKRFQVVQFEPLGEKFDPNIHEAIFTLPESEHPTNHVGAVMQSGWKIGDRVLRAAKVGIVKK
jgi:molecular chaperone GrpE